ncbi:dnaK protein [Trichomonas vaginalis G3]|uniref:DnaK protein n=1 Tax=Trichomonas vaginalis (strain ATCC PRA-98 / G3) TaxID=412133 RepID=A2EVQ1_TRIV3|nr:ATP binding [Trichomonas vaginalis G3]EAY03261.1 dnaK protein [Trichomonas vaginalis G3]KAI5535586.1 ATP binding [Trichomonas vaginalis G3]|eukprot:XP_001315484.1 dnaK protein [Trichomonas vaginalis G3]
MEVCVGIDCGTTNSCIAYADNINSDGKVIQVNGKNFVPTNLIYYKNSNEPLACVDKSTSDIEPGNCLHNIKRIIGKDLLDEDIQNRKSNWDFKLVEGNNKMAAFQVKTKDGRCIVSPEQAAAHVYKKLINAAKSTQESENCKAKVVLTIPVAFNAEQCERIKSAAKAAKIDILSTIYEPTAAAIASNVMSSGKNQKLMIFDFGGGTLDVTIMEMSKDSEGVFKFKTIAITGDPDLGGEVIDEMLMDHFSQILEKYDYKVKTGDDEMTSRNLRTLRDTCHKMKEELTYKKSVDFTWPGINFKPRDSKILSSKFQMMMEEKGYTDRIRTTVKTCLNKANYKPKDVDKVICVGGSSVMKVVKKTLEDIFDEEKISISKHPEEDIAKGAAIYAYLLHSGGVKNVLNTPPPTRQKCPVSIIVENNLPFSIGYTDAYGDMDEIFEKGIVIPVSRTISVSSASNTQSNMYLRVCYRNDYDENPKSLTSYIIDYNGARGDKVKETWSIDAGGNLTITSVLASSGKIISKNVGLFETSSEIYCDSENDITFDCAHNSEINRRNEISSDSGNDRRNESQHDPEMDSIKQQIRDEISNAIKKMKILPQLKSIKVQLDEISRWLDSDEKRTKEEYNKKLEEVRNLVQRGRAPDVSAGINRRPEITRNSENDRRTEITRNSENDNSSESSSFSDTDSSTVSSSDSGNDRRNESQHDPEMDSIKQQIRDEISNAIKKMKILPQLKSIKVQLDEISRWLDSDEKRTKEEYNKKLEEVRNLVQRGRAPDVSAGINRRPEITRNSENDRRTEITRNSENDNSSESSSFSDTDSSTVSSSDSGNDRRNESQHDPEMDSIKQQIRDEISNAIKKMKILPQLKSIKVQLDEISRWLDSDEKRTKEEYNKKLEEVRNLVQRGRAPDVSAGINRRPEITRNSENDRRNESTNNSENDRRPEITRNSENDRRNESPHDSEIDSIKQQIRDEISKGRDSVSRRPVLRVMKGPQLDEISRWLDSDEKRTKEEYNKKLEEVRNLNKRYQTTDASTDDNRRTESFHNPEINRRTETTRNSENDRRDESQHDPEMDSIKQQIRDEISNAIKKMKILPQLKSIKVQLDEISRWLDSDEKRTKEEYNKKLEAVQNLTKRGQMAIR